TLRGGLFHKDMVRVGIGLYGYGSALAPEQPHVCVRGYQSDPDADCFRHAVRWRSRINHVQWCEAETSVGYGRTCRLTRPTLTGVVPVGYADGYPLALSGRGVVTLPGFDHRPAPVLGRVNMDQIVVDLTDTPAAGVVGTPVDLISNEPESPT